MAEATTANPSVSEAVNPSAGASAPDNSARARVEKLLRLKALLKTKASEVKELRGEVADIQESVRNMMVDRKMNTIDAGESKIMLYEKPEKEPVDESFMARALSKFFVEKSIAVTEPLAVAEKAIRYLAEAKKNGRANTGQSNVTLTIRTGKRKAPSAKKGKRGNKKKETSDDESSSSSDEEDEDTPARKKPRRRQPAVPLFELG